MNQKLRIEILKKISQTNSNVQPASSTAIPPAPAILASQAYPNISTAYTSAQINIINNLFNILNVATNIATNGKYNFQVLKNESFSFDSSSFSSPDQKNLVLFFTKAFKILLNGGNAFPATVNAQQLNNMISNLAQSPELKNLSQVNPTGPIAQKIPGNLQQNIISILIRLSTGSVRMV